MKKNLLLWIIAFVLTLFLAIYQRLSGPTHPVQGKEETIPGVEVKYKFNRSGTSNHPLQILITVRSERDEEFCFHVHYRRYPFIEGEDWSIRPMKNKNGDIWVKKNCNVQAEIPGQSAAGKIAYKVEFGDAQEGGWLNHGEFVVARFKGEVPAWLLIPHIVFMFAAMLLAFRAGLEALRPGGSWQRFIPWTLAVTALGGLILGPLVQKYAFGAYWTGFPLGGDLTDTKILFVFFFWLAAFFLRRKSRWWTVAATLLMVAVYLIPHSVLGSELDYKTGKVGTTKF